MGGRHEEARLETKAAALPERLVVEWPLRRWTVEVDDRCVET